MGGIFQFIQYNSVDGSGAIVGSGGGGALCIKTTLDDYQIFVVFGS